MRITRRQLRQLIREALEIHHAPEDLEAMNQIMVKQLKNRYNDPTVNKRFVLGIDRAKMRLYDCEQSAQDNILDSNQEEFTTDTKSKFQGFKI